MFIINIYLYEDFDGDLKLGGLTLPLAGTIVFVPLDLD